MRPQLHISFLLLGASFLWCLGVYGQKNLEKGNRFFGLNQYEKAIPLLTEGIKEAATPEEKLQATFRLADCYRFLGDFENAEKIYKNLLRKGGAEAQFKYGSALKAAAKYAEAKKVFEDYVRKNPSDPRGPKMLRSCDIAQNLLDSEWQYTVRELQAMNTEDEEIAPIFYRGGIVFSSQRPGGLRPFVSFDGGADILLDLYYMEFDGTEESIDNEIFFFPGLNTPNHEGPASFTADGKTVYYTTTVKGKRISKSDDVVQNTLQVFSAMLMDNAYWTEGQSALPFNSYKYSVMHPSVSADGDRMVFASNMPGGMGGTDLYLTYRDKQGYWVGPYNMGPEVNTADNELFPFYGDSTTIYFSSSGHPGMGKQDIFKTTYDPEYGWTAVENMGVPLNSIGDDICYAEMPNTGKGLFVSDRINGTGKADIYAFAKLQPLELEYDEERIWIKNSSAFDALSFSIREEAKKKDRELGLESGYYTFRPDTGIEYRISVRKDGFSYNKIYFTIHQNKYGNKQLEIRSRGDDIKVKLFAGMRKPEGPVADSLIIAGHRGGDTTEKISFWEKLKIAIMGETTPEYDLEALVHYQPLNPHKYQEVAPGVTATQIRDGERLEPKKTGEDGYVHFIINESETHVLSLIWNFEGKKVNFPNDAPQVAESEPKSPSVETQAGD